jgi:hypothetical protein
MRAFERATVGITGAVALAVSVLTATSDGGTADAVVGGVEVSPSIYPAFVRVSSPGSQCGGTVIAPDTVLTAGHCIDDGATADEVSVLVRDVTRRQATAVLVHPLWNGNPTDGHDLGLITLTAHSTDDVVPVQAGSPWDDSYLAADVPATIVGHGATAWGGEATSELRAVDTVLRSDHWMDDIYNHWYWFDGWNEPLHIGAGDSRHTACGGDSGGPLFVDKDGTWTWIQVGVASFNSKGLGFLTDGCDEAAGFTELSNSQLAWVAQHAPSVKDRWGPCLTDRGTVGTAMASYSYDPSNANEGPYHWTLHCFGGSTGGRPTDPTPPAICELHPRKCPETGP